VLGQAALARSGTIDSRFRGNTFGLEEIDGFCFSSRCSAQTKTTALTYA
jgi:hypothetical protein